MYLAHNYSKLFRRLSLYWGFMIIFYTLSIYVCSTNTVFSLCYYTYQHLLHLLHSPMRQINWWLQSVWLRPAGRAGRTFSQRFGVRKKGGKDLFTTLRFANLCKSFEVFWSSNLFECPCLWESCLKWRWLLKKWLKHIICFVDILYSFLPTFVIFVMMNLKIESKQHHHWFAASPRISSWWTSSQLACYQYPCRNSLIDFSHRFPWQMSSVWVLRVGWLMPIPTVVW